MEIQQVTKKHLEGNLKGLETTEKTFHGFKLNKVYSSCVTGNKYQVVKIVKVEIEL